MSRFQHGAHASGQTWLHAEFKVQLIMRNSGVGADLFRKKNPSLFFILNNFLFSNHDIKHNSSCFTLYMHIQ